ncbi:HAD-IIIA family hydrolase [Leptospira interrogans]|uniref:HAD-IIIA family hydrolase n=2 Tax=Leptospira interrogans TaxID=173 RepID=A0AAV9FTV4_LEPIR|nr:MULTISPECIES: HAD-IIIA family hydrolase [Leptospira]EJO77929.1 3-deoxy-D-manno-octulosonate 8-phosphate phosphatase, YrbI family [Leptospira interrogans serovar Pomona str. Kennewicki LC82-25]EKN95527.1 3-deoxy-D-manno-octulosonate 8-phosphate phosphatase, YrbI family [Leptospira interrogans serovar Pomona str. Pomona]EMF35301.1 3-deoxy-D-manno-octulosonate 8-phosphate phosphatase, YrbI family [Leptospira interrogans serovar Pomona str. Fox 32256]EMI63926.1 3-deoxy-D-manno-octulosonate 8-pho
MGFLFKIFFRFLMKNNSIFKKLKLIVIDVDGVLTDGKLYYNEHGEFFKTFDVKDGLGIKLLCKELNVAILSGNTSKIIHARAKSLGIKHCMTGIDDKKTSLQSLMNQLGISLEEVAYIGDDINDLPVRSITKLFACPSDAHPSVKKVADLILKSRGGNGAVREFADYVLSAKGILDSYILQGLFEKNV